MVDREKLVQDGILIFFGDQMVTDSDTDQALLHAIENCVDAMIAGAGDDLDEHKVLGCLQDLRARAWVRLLEETYTRIERLKLECHEA